MVKIKYEYLFLVTIFIISTCGLIYELIAGTLASYLLGDSVMQFSLIIGIYLFSMGVGSFLSKFFTGDKLISRFVEIEINRETLSFQFDALCCAEPMKPESGQYPTTQTKVLLDSPKSQPKICSLTNNRQSLLGNNWIWET